MSKKKNVLFIVIDDLRTQLGCYGMPWVISPNIDRLAAEGVRFERAYCQQAICGPSRVSVLSGCRPDTTGIYNLEHMLRDTMPDVTSLPEHFKKHGYETISIGKVYHHQADDPQGWSGEPIINKGDWKGRGYLTDEAMEAFERRAAEAEARGEKPRGLGPSVECADVADDDYPDGKDARAAIGELQRLAGESNPFFMAVGFHKPHLPFNAPKRYWDMYDRDALPLASNPFTPENATAYTLQNFGELRQYIGMPGEGPVPEPDARMLIHGYCACVTYVDAQVGRVLDELERLGLADNTTVMLWGDHGWKLGEHASWCKHSNMEIDTRAPFVIRDPNATGNGSTSQALVEFVDMYPTLCECADLPVPEHCEGRSLAPLLADPQRDWPHPAFSQYPRRDNIMGYAMRTDRYRYVEWRDRDTGQVRARELYDHANDGEENRNVVDEVDPSVVDQLAAQLATSWPAPAR